ncbi:hypothetical protein [Streptomyces hokutonensis]|uniref:hypothetical protein n=1 Tax=Streptomyces hokutonensis TaxID=1306990 RepID=UPI0038253CBE
MAPLDISVPNVRGYDFGVGVDRLSGTPMNQAVKPTPSPPHAGQGAVQSFDVSRVYTNRDLQSGLGIDLEASYGCATFGAGASARFSYMKESQVHSSCLFMTVTAAIHLADISIDESVLTQPARDITGRKDVFTARYGDMFCRACSRGGLFVGVMRIETQSSKDATSIEGSLRGSYGLFSAQAQAKFKSVTEQYNASVYCSLYAEGGPELKITDPSDPTVLLSNANAWMQAMHADPDTYARPYEWTLSPLSIAEAPLPDNEAQIQHAQDVLMFCARERTTLLDRLNLLEWIHDHPERFDWAGAVPPEQIQSAARSVQNDLDLVAQCASAAIDHPASALMPATYAAAQTPPTTYPAGVVPAPLPQQHQQPASATILIPSMIGMTNDDWEQAGQCLARNASIDEVIAGTFFMNEDGQGFHPVPSISRQALEFMQQHECQRQDISEKSEGEDPYPCDGDKVVTAQFPPPGTLVAPGTDLVLQWSTR